jgi:hypothetical protein
MRRNKNNVDRVKAVIKENKAKRATRSPQEQINLLKTRPGNSKKEIDKLNKLIENKK